MREGADIPVLGKGIRYVDASLLSGPGDGGGGRPLWVAFRPLDGDIGRE